MDRREPDLRRSGYEPSRGAPSENMTDRSRSLRGTVTGDPLQKVPVGTSIPIQPVMFSTSNAALVPGEVDNWDFFDGALLSVGIRRPGVVTQDILGSAVVIAPGLALTATHVISEVLSDLSIGRASIYCVGVRSAGLDIWRVRSLSYTEDSDLTYLALELVSDLTPDWRFTSFGLTTRAPRVGETLTVLGFRFADIQVEGSGFVARGDLYAAVGKVANVYHPMRDYVLMPYPTIEVLCGSVGAMSGGAVMDRKGLLVGVVGRGLATEDGRGPTYCPWVMPALHRRVDIPWPPGVYGNGTSILEVPEPFLFIEGRDAIRLLNGGAFEYRVWFGESEQA